MRQVVLAVALSTLGVASLTVPAAAQPPAKLGPPVRQGFDGFPPDNSHLPRPGEENVADLRGWLDGSLKAKGKQPQVDPKLLKDMLEKMRNGQDQPDQTALKEMIKGNERFKDPEFLKWLENQVGKPDSDLKDNLKQQLNNGGGDPKVVDQPNLKDKIGNFVEEAKKPAEGGGKFPDGQFPDGKPPEFPDANAGPKLDPAAQEWIKWMEKNFGDSPAGQQAMKDLTESLGKGDFKGMFDDMPEFKNGEWNQFNEWGKGAFGDGWKVRPPDWNLGGNSGLSGPKFGGGGGGWNIGGGPSVNGPSVGGVEAAGGGLTAVAVVIGVIGALVLGYILYRKWQQDQEAKLAMLADAKRGLDLSHIRSRQELVEAFDALTVEKCGDESKNWNHRVVTETLIGARPAVAQPAQELGELYQKARYAPPQDDMTGGEFTAAERDLRAVAGVTP